MRRTSDWRRVQCTVSPSQCWPTSIRHCIIIVKVFAAFPNILFTSSILSISKCWPISSRHYCVYIVPILSCSHRQHRLHRNVDRHQVDKVSTSYFCNVFDVKLKKYMQYKQFKLNIDSTSYKLRYRHMINSILFKQRRRCDVDDVYVNELSARSSK